MIDNASIESLKSTLDIVDVIGNFIELRKIGGNYKANCPFHGEKTPSFTVSDAKQIYHCFGCGVGGDSIKFVMEFEKLSYPEAIEKLASMNNFSLSYTKGSSDYSQSKHLLESISKWYIKNLNQNSVATKYLEKRGISSRAIEKFSIGFVPSSKEVMQFLQQNILPIPQALESGIVAKSDDGGRYYARLVERITFPIHSTNGALVGFGGRTITNHPAKYINSPQTKIFNKSRLLYGYHLAKKSIYETKKIIICEGYLDVVMFHQAGFIQAVASMGTALTKDHIPLLRKGEPKVILAYDGDKAGINAGVKASEMLSIAGIDGGIVLFPDGQDPADLIADGKSELVASLLREAKLFTVFVLETIASSYNLYEPLEKENAFKEMKSYLEKLSPIIGDAYISTASSLLGIESSFFGTKTSIILKKENFRENKEGLAYLNILKTLIEVPLFLEIILPFMSVKDFHIYGEVFSKICNNEWEDSMLIRLSLDEKFKILTKDELIKNLNSLMMSKYITKLKEITGDSSIAMNKKVFLIKKIKMDILPRLKKGELVSLKLI